MGAARLRQSNHRGTARDRYFGSEEQVRVDVWPHTETLQLETSSRLNYPEEYEEQEITEQRIDEAGRLSVREHGCSCSIRRHPSNHRRSPSLIFKFPPVSVIECVR